MEHKAIIGLLALVIVGIFGIGLVNAHGMDDYDMHEMMDVAPGYHMNSYHMPEEAYDYNLASMPCWQ